MWLGIVIGNVWCTKKVSALTGQTFLLVDASVVGIVDRVEQ